MARKEWDDLLEQLVEHDRRRLLEELDAEDLGHLHRVPATQDRTDQEPEEPPEESGERPEATAEHADVGAEATATAGSGNDGPDAGRVPIDGGASTAIKHWVKAGFRRAPVLLLTLWSVLVVVLAAGVVAAWLLAIPRVWTWMWAGTWLRWIGAPWAILALATMPLGFLFLAWERAGRDFRAYFEAKSGLQDRMEQNAILESEVQLRHLNKLGPIGTMLTYTQKELRAYHRDALTRNRKSFRNFLAAAWIGFAFIILGSVPYLVPLDFLAFEVTNGQPLLIASGAITNAVGVLFFFAYRDSQVQATYYYDRQRFGHAVATCYLMAEGLQGKAKEEATMLVVERFLDRKWTVKRPRGHWERQRGSSKGNLAEEAVASSDGVGWQAP